MAQISPFAFFQLLDNNGDPLAGGKLHTFDAGTSTPKQTFTTEDESTANANPVILDASGRANVWLDSGSYKFRIDDSADVTIATVDDISGEASNVFGSTIFDISTNTNVTAIHQNNVLNCTAAVTLSLLDVSTAEEGFVVTIKNSSAGNVTIDPDGAELIDGAATKTIGPNGSVIIDCTGTAWITFAEDVGTTNSRNMSNTGNNSFSGKVSFLDDGELTIATGAITITGANHTVDTEADAASDDLDTLNGGVDGEVVILRAENAARTVIIKDGTGNIETSFGKDITLDETEKVVLLEYDLALDKWLVISSPLDETIVQGQFFGLTLSPDTDTAHDINVTAGQAADSTNASYLTLLSETTKQIDATWTAGDDAGGLFSGTVAVDTTYHFFIIEKDSDGSTDAGFDTSVTAANIPAGYTKFRRVGSVVTDGSANIINFVQFNDDFYLDTPVLDINDAATGTTANTGTLASIPTGIVVKAILNAVIASNGTYVYISALANTDVAPSSTVAPLAFVGTGTGANTAGNTEVFTNTSAQIRYRTSANDTLRIATLGYKDTRGK